MNSKLSDLMPIGSRHKFSEKIGAGIGRLNRRLFPLASATHPFYGSGAYTPSCCAVHKQRLLMLKIFARAKQVDRERLFVIAKFIWLIENQLVMRTSQLKLAVTFNSRSPWKAILKKHPIRERFTNDVCTSCLKKK